MLGRSVCTLFLIACSGSGPRPSDRSDTTPSAVGDAAAGRGSMPAAADGGSPLAMELTHPFLLPDKPGRGRSEVQGCAAHPETADQPPTRTALPPARLAVQLVRGGMLVTHELPHACCLKAEIATRVVGMVVRVHEALSGTPCRCMCESTLRTGVALSPGRYRLVVELERAAGRTEIVREESISIP